MNDLDVANMMDLMGNEADISSVAEGFQWDG